jgi:4-hydroxythreonine-4-phosphate dehydrogenase
MKKPIRIAITSGDIDGIGTEVIAKALYKLKPQKNIQFILWRSPDCPKSHLNLIDKYFRRFTFSSWPDAMGYLPKDGKDLIEIVSNQNPALWVEQSALAAKFGHIDAIATAPLSKKVILKAGLSDIGHTDILKRIAEVEDVYMGFIGAHFSVVLATGHLPIHKVTKAWSVEQLQGAIAAAKELRELLGSKEQKKAIGILGLNPHAGENGMLGDDAVIYKEAIKKFKNLEFSGPLVPDVAFQPEQRSKHAIYVCAYHDQGLIPFKMLHGRESGVHISLGLPFVRTSVDHGTAKDIFGKNKADYHSMLEALEWAISLAKERRKLT